MVFLKSICKFINFLLRDHNGKPSSSRLLMWVWTLFSIGWINHEVGATNIISDNAVVLVVISILGPTISMVLKKAPPSIFAGFLEQIAKKRGSDYGSWDSDDSWGKYNPFSDETLKGGPNEPI